MYANSVSQACTLKCTHVLVKIVLFSLLNSQDIGFILNYLWTCNLHSIERGRAHVHDANLCLNFVQWSMLYLYTCNCCLNCKFQIQYLKHSVKVIICSGETLPCILWLLNYYRNLCVGGRACASTNMCVYSIYYGLLVYILWLVR